MNAVDVDNERRLRVVGSLLALVALASGIIAISLCGAVLFRTFFGDPTIYLIYARNIANGDVFQFNAGHFSSGSTSPLWAAILAIPYVLGFGATGAKVVALAATVSALVVAAWATTRITGSQLAGTLGALLIVGSMTFWGVMMYESALIVALVSAGLVAGDRVVSAEPTERLRPWVALTLVWACMPLSRPDAVVLVAIHVVALLVVGVRPRPTFIAGGVAALPSVLYFGYSKVDLGVFSVSSASRSFALREVAQHVGPIAYSSSAADYFRSILPLTLVGAVGLALLYRDRKLRWVSIYGLGALAVYPVLLIFVSPVTSDFERYFLPAVPMIGVGVASVIRESWRTMRSPARARDVAFGVVLSMLGVFAAVGVFQRLDDPYRMARVQSGLGYSFDNMVERDAASVVNGLAAPGAVLLAYEVQDRYYLRRDVELLSLDGLTDGKVLPYLDSGDMRAFLLRYRPHLWLMNNAPTYRPYLEDSILRAAYDRLTGSRRLSTTRISGLTFKVLARRTKPVPKGSSAWWQAVVAIDYPASPTPPREVQSESGGR